MVTPAAVPCLQGFYTASDFGTLFFITSVVMASVLLVLDKQAFGGLLCAGASQRRRLTADLDHIRDAVTRARSRRVMMSHNNNNNNNTTTLSSSSHHHHVSPPLPPPPPDLSRTYLASLRLKLILASHHKSTTHNTTTSTTADSSHPHQQNYGSI